MTDRLTGGSEESQIQICCRGKWRQLAQPDDLAAVSKRPPDESGLDLADKQEFYQDHMSEAAIRLAAHVAALDGEAIIKISDKLLKADATARKSLKLDTATGDPIIQLAVLCGGASPANPAKALPSMVRPQKQLPNEAESD